MIRHVGNVVAHWKGKIRQWDVVNEAFAGRIEALYREDGVQSSATEAIAFNRGLTIHR